MVEKNRKHLISFNGNVCDFHLSIFEKSISKKTNSNLIPFIRYEKIQIDVIVF